jgi:hypothetical protein
MTYFLVNPRFPEELCRGLMPYGEVLRAPEFSALDFPVSAHPDMQAANVCGNLFIHGENEALSALLESRGIAFRRISARAGRLYPADVALNLFTVKNFLFANTGHAGAEVLDLAEKNGFTPVYVKQGYAKCSAMLLGDAIVTADKGIYRAAALCGIDALLVSPGGVGIEKYGAGFIGGASGTLCRGKTAVFGDILTHPDGEKILAFARAHGEEIISLGTGALFDYGGIVRIDT